MITRRERGRRARPCFSRSSDTQGVRVRERTDADPVVKTAAELAASDKLHRSLSDRLYEADMPQVDPRQLCDIRIYRQVDLEARIGEIEVDHRQ